MRSCRAIHQRDRLVDITGRERGECQELRSRGVHVVEGRGLPHTSRYSVRRVDRRRHRKDLEGARIRLVTGDLRYRLDNQSFRNHAGICPPAAKSGALQKIERQVPVTLGCCIAGDGHQLCDCVQVAGHAIVEDLAQPRHPRNVVRR